MKLFTKLALVSAVAISSNAMAMQAMDDAALSATTGQDGISIGIGITKVEIAKLHVFDGDGLKTDQVLYQNSAGTNVTGANVGGTGAAGAITINNVVVSAPTTDGQPLASTGANLDTSRTLASHNLADLTIDTDGNGGSPFLNIAAAVSGLDISLGKIEVNDVTGTAGAYVAGTGSAEILSGLSLKTGKMTANVQLGNTPQGAMIKLDGKMVGGLEIKNLALKDASAGGGGYIAIGGIKLKDTVGSDLSLDTDIAVKPTGLAITAMKNSTDIYITKVVLGGGSVTAPTVATGFNGTGAGSASIGDVAISGMKVYNGLGMTPGAVITIAGH
ncbi:MAG: pilus assembly protein FilA [Acinetobacter sp.]